MKFKHELIIFVCDICGMYLFVKNLGKLIVIKKDFKKSLRAFHDFP